MRRFAGKFKLTIVLVLAFGLMNCGGGSKKLVPTSVSVSPSSLSLSFGQVQQITASVLDQNGNVLAADLPTFSSDNPAVQVSSTGLVCAGTWDAAFIVCTPATTATSATISVKFGSVAPATVSVAVHPHIDNVIVKSVGAVPDVNACVSETGTAQFTAIACSATGANPSPNCPTSAPNDVTAQAGAVAWTVLPGNVATADANQQSLVTITAVQPGQANILASIGGANSAVSANSVFTTCPVKNITVTASNNPFTVAVGTATTLTATVTDTSGATITNVPLTWSSSQPATMTVSSGALTSTATPVAAGSSTVVASCTPPTCNTNLYPVYSNATVGSVTGASATTVYVASKGSTSLFPVDATSNTVGAAITLPATPNSMMFNAAGTRLFLGSSDRLMVVDVTASTPTVSVSTAAPGTLLAVSPDGNQVMTTNGATVYVLNTSTAAQQAFAISGATHASFTPDSLKAYIATPTGVWAYTAGTTPRNLGGGANDVSVLAQGSFVFLAGTGNVVKVDATCNNAQATAISTSTAPQLVSGLPDASQVIAADSTNLNIVDVATDGSTTATSPSACSTSLSHATARAPLPTGFAPSQIVVTPDSSTAYVLAGDQPRVLAYSSATGTAASIGLQTASGSPAPTGVTTGGVTLDSAHLFVGSLGDNAVHRIDTATLTDTAQIAISSGFVPDLVAVRPK